MGLRKIITGSLLGGALIASYGCDRRSAGAGAGPPQMPPPPVTIAQAVTQDVPVYLDEIGSSAASESVMVTPQVSGRITERHFTDGADLKKGQLLFTIDARPFEAVLHQAEGTLAKDQAAAASATALSRRNAELFKQDMISAQDNDQSRFNAESAAATVRADEATVEAARLNIEYCTIHSPMDGRAGKRLVDAGNVVTSNETSLLSIQRIDPIYVDFTITERDLPAVRKEMTVGTLKTLVRVPSEAQKQAREGDLTFLDNRVQDGTGTVNLRASLPNADQHFWPGQYVQVRLVLETKKDAVLVPNEATQISQHGPFVYVIKPDSTAELRQVTLGQRQEAMIVVEKGMAAGEQVVVTGQLAVTPGGKVRIETGAEGTGAGPDEAAGRGDDSTAKERGKS